MILGFIVVGTFVCALQSLLRLLFKFSKKSNSVVEISISTLCLRDDFVCVSGTFCCWLKSAVPTPITNQDYCTSGITGRKDTRHPPAGMRSAVPLGGMGTGSFELRADGTFHEWTIEKPVPWWFGQTEQRSPGSCSVWCACSIRGQQYIFSPPCPSSPWLPRCCSIVVLWGPSRLQSFLQVT